MSIFYLMRQKPIEDLIIPPYIFPLKFQAISNKYWVIVPLHQSFQFQYTPVSDFQDGNIFVT